MIEKMTRKRAIKSWWSLALACTLMLGCGQSPSDPPLPQTGAIKISARIETVPVDSVFVKLDNVPQGWLPNGCVLADLLAGRHEVAVSTPDPNSPIDFSSVPQLVAVRANETTTVSLALSKFAPNFTLKNLKDQDITLANYQGKVVLLVFFSHT